MNPKPIVVDTDIFSDVDDVGALAVANVLHNLGLADLRGVCINTHSRYGALAASTINTYYGNGDVPIATIRPCTNETFLDTYTYTSGEYASKLAYNFPRTLEDPNTTPEPAMLYREVLAAAQNNSITLISVGFLDNLAALLNTTSDEHSSLSGKDLVATKVKELVIMGGQYPSGWEYNFGGATPLSASYVVNNWPGAMTFSGGELGAEIYSGQNLAVDAPADSPVLAAYEWYVGRCSTIRESWDPLTVLYGVLGLDDFDDFDDFDDSGQKNLLKYANTFGYNHVMADGSNAWVNDTSVTNQHWLELADGIMNASIARVLNQLYVATPVQIEFPDL